MDSLREEVLTAAHSAGLGDEELKALPAGEARGAYVPSRQ
jgi:hypothetical protein